MSAPTAVYAPPSPNADGTIPAPGKRPRMIGVDVARGLAVIGMIATHTLPMETESGSPTTVSMLAAGRAAATFVVVAGVSVAFLSGGRDGVRGRRRVAASSGLVVRAMLVLVLGLALGLLATQNGIWGILPFYGLLFVLALPLLGLRAPALLGVTAAVFVLGPILLVATAGANLPYAGADDPTFSTLVNDPLGLLVQLLLSGAYPVVVYLGYLSAGLAIGRLDLSSRRVAWWLFGGGLALAVAARAVSWYVLYPLGGLARLVQESGSADDPAQVATQLLSEEHQPLSTWWHLALPAPHSHTPIDLLHSVGSAAAVLGAALLLTRLPVLRRLLSPLAAVGSLALTLYCTHLVLLATGIWSDQPALLFGAMLAGALALSVAWRRWIGQGPLEKLVSLPAGATRQAVSAHMARRPAHVPQQQTASSTSGGGLRAAAGLVAVAVVVAALGIAVLTRMQQPGPALDGDPLTSQYETESPDEADEPDDAEAPDDAASAAPAPAPGAPTSRTPALGGTATADTARYCALSDRHASLMDTDAELTQTDLEMGAAMMEEMQRVAPAEILGPVTVLVDDSRAEAGAAGVATPDSAAVETAETTIDEFETRSCS